MPAVGALSIEGWGEVQKAYELGVDSATLSRDFGVSMETIKKRRQREGWRSLEDVKEEMREKQSRRDESQGLSRNVPKGVEVAAERLLANGETGSLLMSNLALALLKAAKPDTLKPLQDIGDVMTAGKAVRLPAGMDKADSQQVTVNLGGWQASVKAHTGAAGFIELEGESGAVETDSQDRLEDSGEQEQHSLSDES